jgi:hypothetical protein
MRSCQQRHNVFPHRYSGLGIAAQICHIELYQKTVLRCESRDIGSEGTAREWIQRYAEYFPN